MAWSKEIAEKRVKLMADATKASDYRIVDLTRERDFYNLGRFDICRAHGTHVYADVTNMHLLVADAGGDLKEQKRLIRRASIIRRLQSEIADEQGVGKIQMQSARFHGMCFKPYDAERESREADRVLCAVKFAITMRSLVADVMNVVFDKSTPFHSAAGIDSGRFLIANIGYHGDRELISLGTAANIAAKAIQRNGTIGVTENAYKLLPECLREKFVKSNVVGGVQIYRASNMTWKGQPKLAEELDVKFDHDRWIERAKEAKKNLPLDEMNVSGVESAFDPLVLTERNSKRLDGAPLFADIDGFTPCVQKAEDDDDDLKALVRTFHLIRAEFQAVIQNDYDGLALQHQGDCVLGFSYLPAGDEQGDRRRRKAVNIAIGLQSSMTHVLPTHLSGCGELHLAVGVAAGKVIVTRLGKQGEREVVAIGPSVDESQALQRAACAQQICISAKVYDALNDEIIKGEFEKSGDFYCATGLTFPKLEDLNDAKEKEAARSSTLSTRVTSSGVGIVTGVASSFRPYCPEE